MSWEGPDVRTQTRTVSAEYLEELYAKAARLRDLDAAVWEWCVARGDAWDGSLAATRRRVRAEETLTSLAVQPCT